jgi:hypothetical protein
MLNILVNGSQERTPGNAANNVMQLVVHFTIMKIGLFYWARRWNRPWC